MYFKEYIENYITEVFVEIDGKTYKSKKEAEADMKAKGYASSKIKNKLEHARIAHGKLTPDEQIKLAKAAKGSIGSDLIGNHYMNHKVDKSGNVHIYSSNGHQYYIPKGASHVVKHPNSVSDPRVGNKIHDAVKDAHERMVKKAKEEADKD